MLQLTSLLAACLALACACGPRPETMPPVASATPTAAPTTPAEQAAATPEPEPPAAPQVLAKAEDLPAAGADAVTVDGWKKVRIGMTTDELGEALGVKISLKDDADYQEYRCTQIRPKGLPPDVSIMISDEKVARIDVYARGVLTYGGVQVGDKAPSVKALFGAVLNAQPHFYSGSPAEYLTIWTQGGSTRRWDGPPSPEQQAKFDASRGIRFETNVDGVITMFHAGSGAIERVEGCL